MVRNSSRRYVPHIRATRLISPLERVKFTIFFSCRTIILLRAQSRDPIGPLLKLL